jgi:uncharacterized protein (UPF0276 family)
MEMHGDTKTDRAELLRDVSRPFCERVRDLPRLGLGISTEYGARTTGLDPFELVAHHPHFASFLEVGVEVVKGLDTDAKRWTSEGRATTYHFLDVNLDEPEDFDPAWLASVRDIVDALKPAWLCGDAGLWHFGPRERAQMLLLPPILTRGSARAMADGIARLRASTGLEVLPENPPGQVFLGDLHLIEYFAEVCDLADTGLLLDVAHLAIYQKAQGHTPMTALDALPYDRVVEMHVAGGTPRLHEGLPWIDDTHGGDVLPEVWSLFEHLVPRCPNLRAVVFECERNRLGDTLEGFRRIAEVLDGPWSTPRDSSLRGSSHG